MNELNELVLSVLALEAFSDELRCMVTSTAHESNSEAAKMEIMVGINRLRGMTKERIADLVIKERGND